MGIFLFIFKHDFITLIIYLFIGIIYLFRAYFKERMSFSDMWKWCKNHIEEILTWMGIGITIVLLMRAFGVI